MTDSDSGDPRRGDLALCVFTDHGPWQIQTDDMAWRAGVPALRRATRRRLPKLIEPSHTGFQNYKARSKFFCGRMSRRDYRPITYSFPRQ